MIQMRYGLLADYAVPGMAGKATVVGVFDSCYTAPNEGDVINTPQHTIHIAFDGLEHDGPRHLLQLKLVDPDANEVCAFEMPINLVPKPDGTGTRGYAYFRVEEQIAVPDFGAYAWVVYVDGIRQGEIPLSIGRVTGQIRTEIGMPPAEDSK